MSSGDAFSLPVAPPELCFDKDEFSKKSFSVDEFLHQHRNAAGLETMRDDLGVYLKVLRSAMIELINEDYADFVNLSSNLIGLDQSIGSIQSPLGQLREEIVHVKTTLTDTMSELAGCLDDKRSLRGFLKSIRSAAKVQLAIQQMDQLLRSDGIDETLLERAALSYVQIAFDLQFCQDVVESNPGLKSHKVSEIHKRLQQRIEQHFLVTLKEQNIERLERCLRIFCTLDECQEAERIFRRHVVAEHMKTIINEPALQNSPQGLQGIYKQVLLFVEQHMVPLLTLTCERQQVDTDGRTGGCRVKGFDFVLNSFWTEVEQRLETQMSSIFAPGNPDQFYQKYQHTMGFLERLDEIIGTPEGIRRLRQHGQYKSFQNRWNLRVYFQIRFQEVGGALEAAFSQPLDAKLLSSSVNPDSNRTTTFIPISTAIAGIQKCWSVGFYLPQIFVRFLKLTLQILSRTAQWISEFTAIEQWPGGTEQSLVDVLVFLYMDITKLDLEIPTILSTITRKLDDQQKHHVSLLEKCFDDSKHILHTRQLAIQSRLVREIATKSAAQVKQVSDIPRMFRKTNREVPSKAFAYVDQMLDSAVQFAHKYQSQVDTTVVHQVLVDIFCELNRQYFTAVEDVLTSVQKTEESLRRLKNLREKTASLVPNDIPSGSSGSASGTGSGVDQRTVMSDDDKIRLQLHVDVTHWASSIELLGVELHSVERLEELMALVLQSSPLRSADK